MEFILSLSSYKNPLAFYKMRKLLSIPLIFEIRFSGRAGKIGDLLKNNDYLVNDNTNPETPVVLIPESDIIYCRDRTRSEKQ